MKWIMLAASLSLSAAFVCAQGPLTPPGAPAATMKTLQQVEPRTPLSSGATLSQPGSYYLTTNVAGTININASGVTLDLMGFQISGGGLTVTNQTINGGVIRNGILANTGGTAINGYNTVSSFTRNMVVENIMVLNSGFQGIRAGVGWTLRNVQVQESGGTGITGLRDVTVEQCIVRSNGLNSIGNGISLGERARISHTTSDHNMDAGIITSEDSILQDIRVCGNGSYGLLLWDRSLAEQVLASSNGDDGILAAGNSTRILDSVAISNGVNGISVGTAVITGCLAADNQEFGIRAGNDSIVRSSTASRNGDGGIFLDMAGSATDCIADENGVAAANPNADGFKVVGWVNLKGNVSVRNQGDGIQVTGSQCTIDENIVRSNQGMGINLAANNNVVTRNSVNLNTITNINFSGGSVAPWSSVAAATHPFANFQ